MASRKRKTPPTNMDNVESSNTTKRCRRRLRLKLEDAPPVNCIADLVEIGKSVKFYKNLDTVMLWRIAPYLEQLDQMIGLNSLKETVFFQVIYYLQNMHTRNQNEEYLHTLILGPPGHGKCLAKDTPILMYDGSICVVQNIQKGDLLMGDDSTPRKVLSTCTGKEMMYMIKQDYGLDYVVNESHILSLKLTKEPYISVDGGIYQVTWFDYEDVKQRSFSNVDQATKFIETVTRKGDIIDISVLEYLKRSESWKDAFKGYKVPIDFPRMGISYAYEIGYNLISHIPDDFKYVSKEERIELLAGILDSCGFSYRDRYDVIIFEKSFACDVIWLLRSLGFRAELFWDRAFYRIIFYCDVLIPCKIIKPKITNITLTSNIKVEKLQRGRYYGFEIDRNKRFVLGDFTVTHNTEVAKIIGKIYQAMGILSRSGGFKIAHRDDFIAEYLGQTAIKTRKLLKSCLGGVLFIDEVYSLAPTRSDKDSFAKEALDTLTAFLSEHKNDICCIAAGYEDDVRNCFFAMNKGLERRFTWVHRIDTYTPMELAKIFMKMVREIKWDIAFSVDDVCRLLDRNKKLFTNAGGDIETFISKCKMMHSRRVFSLGKEHKFILTVADLENAIEYIKKYTKLTESLPPPGLYT